MAHLIESGKLSLQDVKEAEETLRNLSLGVKEDVKEEDVKKKNAKKKD